MDIATLQIAELSQRCEKLQRGLIAAFSAIGILLIGFLCFVLLRPPSLTRRELIAFG